MFERLTVLLHIQEFSSSYLYPEIAYRGFPETLETNAGLVPHITLRSLSSTTNQSVTSSISIHQQPQLLTALLNKQLINTQFQ